MLQRSPRNKTLCCTEADTRTYAQHIQYLNEAVAPKAIEGRVMCGDLMKVAGYLPTGFIDLLILDPPYNLDKNFSGNVFKKQSDGDYRLWFDRVLSLLHPMLKPQATIYVCSDWRTSALIFPVLDKRWHVRNRITWARDKGRGAKSNWKNNAEDIWFCTRSREYYFNVDAVKVKRKVIAPYREQGVPKDWQEEKNGCYRLTHPSNMWTDMTVPFWSMPENTEHPTQKPEKLMAKLILASSKKGDFVFDPFLGSGTTAVVAEKLGRRWAAMDINATYLCWALKRLAMAKENKVIQGYQDGIFWERNTSLHQQCSSH
ncbi:MAG: site-specific DNA-methyltransferase [Alphaproteobacteria bacterium GM202ARS2]|nr:site-specific DNA-methyltransferase [Alphaproteobacteria bacterium GM202ARS2]